MAGRFRVWGAVVVAGGMAKDWVLLFVWLLRTLALLVEYMGEKFEVAMFA